MTARTQAKFFLPILVLLIAGVVYYSLVASKTQRERPALVEKVWQVEIIEAQHRQLAPSITLYGRIESPDQLKAAAPGGGVIEKVFVRNGAHVKQGEPLVIMDRRDFAAALLGAEADLRDIDNQVDELKVHHQSNLASLETERKLLGLADAEVERLLKLKAQNLGADTAINSSRSELERRRLAVTSRELDVDSYPARLQILLARRDRGQAELDQARLAMTRSKVNAPFDAIINEVAVSAGDRVMLGQVLISLFPVNKLEIRAHLPLNYIRSVQHAITEDQNLYARVANRKYLGQFPVVRVAGEAEATGIDVYFSIDSIVGQLRPGDLLPLTLELPVERDVFAVPYQAIYGNSRIYKVVEDRLQVVEVNSVGQAQDESGTTLVLIRSEEISPGDQIAVTHLPNAVSGLKVRIDGQ
jgi:multidrug efflux pump subunit AcrA (membrane-fusion protein)